MAYEQFPSLSLAAALNLFVKKAGDTMSGALNIAVASSALNVGSASPFSTTSVVNVQNASGVASTIALVGDGANSTLIQRRFSNDAVSAFYLVAKGRGSAAAPSQTLAGDGCFLLQASGYDNGGTPTTRTVGSISFSAVSNVTTTSAEGQIDINVTPAGAVTPSPIARYTQASGFLMYGANVVVDANRLIRCRVFTVGTLPAVADGAHAHVSDATATLTAGIGAVVVGGGGNHVPVVADTANWRIG